MVKVGDWIKFKSREVVTDDGKDDAILTGKVIKIKRESYGFIHCRSKNKSSHTWSFITYYYVEYFVGMKYQDSVILKIPRQSILKEMKS